MRAWIQTAAAFACAAVLAGCAHPIDMATDKSVPTTKVEPKIARNAAFVIPDALRDTEVTTPGGGGDKVSYFPYRDLEAPLYATLSSVFANVSKLRTTNDEAAIRKGQVSFIVTPVITTDSSSDSALTWPPTRFTVRMMCTVTDPSGTVLLKKEVTGQGNAEFSEFRRNFGLSAQRASEDMLKRLQEMLATAPELRAAGEPVGQITTGVPLSKSPAPAASSNAATATASSTTTVGDLRGLMPAR